MKYLIKARHPRTGKIHAFESGDVSKEELDASVELFAMGFEIISVEPVSES